MITSMINGYPITVEYNFWPGFEARWTADREPDEPDEVEITDILDEHGTSVFKWIGDADVDRIMDECIQAEKLRRLEA